MCGFALKRLKSCKGRCCCKKKACSRGGEEMVIQMFFQSAESVWWKVLLKISTVHLLLSKLGGGRGRGGCAAVS